MFDAVLEKQLGTSGRSGEGAFFSLAIHALLIGTFALISAHAGGVKGVPEPQMPRVVIERWHRDPPIVVQLPASRQNPAKTHRKPKPSAKNPVTAAPRKPPSHSPPPAAPLTTDLGGTGGTAQNPTPNPSESISEPCVAGNCTKPAITRLETDVLVFGAGMTPPDCSGTRLHKSALATAAQIQGTAIVQCAIRKTGERRNCRMLKSVPYMDEAILSAFSRQPCASPVRFQGQAQEVLYTFRVQVH